MLPKIVFDRAINNIGKESPRVYGWYEKIQKLLVMANSPKPEGKNQEMSQKSGCFSCRSQNNMSDAQETVKLENVFIR